ncbi:glucokinase [Aquimonas voraii]|uniref:Glucokinase n=1 Tax=Aquimonas voraii TaxID=265719 RepID=A0A1G6UNP4_9GAMM|nr:glucokinase [Aquimonas voraii]SDD42972.1 glucokinase [Aquimonas voraii]
MSLLLENRRDPLLSLQARCLAADIGGTNARFATAALGNNDRIRLGAQRNLKVADYEGVESALESYFRESGEPVPERAVLAVAGAVLDDQVILTNSRWSFSIRALKQRIGFRELQVINDFAAVAWAVPGLGEADLHPIGSAPGAAFDTAAVQVVLGPGTGLGAAAIRRDARGLAVLETEGGHASFAPHDEREIFILRFLQKRYGRVSYERLLCGEGLVNLHDACLHMARGRDQRLPDSEAVVAAARAGDPDARSAIDLFCSILGRFAGDAVLLYGGWAGVFLAGGLLPHVLDARGEALFRAAFIDKGRFSPLLSRTPTFRIVAADIGTLGAARVGLTG